MNEYEIEDKNIFEKYCNNKYTYYPLILPARKDNEKIIVIGDLHGDFNLTLNVLRLGKVIDNNNNWIGGNTYVVQVGDQLDNCRPLDKKCDDPSNIYDSPYSGNTPEDIKVLEFMTKLNIKATKEGGAVISLLGNHEIMNVMGNLNYVSYNDVNKFSNYTDPTNKNKKFKDGKAARLYAFSPGNEYAKILACTRMPALIIGSYIFVHAGFVKTFVDEMKMTSKYDLIKISVIIKKWLLGLINKDYVIDIINSKSYSLFWDRILGNIPPNTNLSHPDCVNYLTPSLEILDVKQMFIGHTPQHFAHNIGINSTCGDKLWRVDFGGSFGFNKFDNNMINFRNAQVLEIVGDKGDIKILK